MNTATIRPSMLLVALLALTGVVRGDQVIITTGTIAGNISLGSIPIWQVSVSASSSGLSSSSYSLGFNSPQPTVVPYSVTVGFPQGASPLFAVQPYVYTDSYRDYLQLQSSGIQVSANAAASLDFNVTPGFVQAVFTVTDGGTLSSASLYASKSGWYAQTSATPSQGYVFPVVPGTAINVSGSASVSSGGTSSSVTLPTRTIDVAAGQTVQVFYTVTPPPPPPAATGSITGTVSFAGGPAIQQAYVSVSGPTSQSINLNPYPSGGAYTVGPLASGTYSAYAYAYLNGFDDYFQFPNASFSPQRTVAVGTGPVTVNISADQAFVNGTVRLSGLADLPAFSPFNTPYVSADGVSTPSSGGYSQDRMTPANGAFDLTVSPGNWRVNQLYAPLRRTAPYLNQTYFYYYDYRANRVVTAASGSPANLDFDLVLGEVALRIGLAGGGLLSDPRLSGTCYERDVNGTYLWYYSFNSQSDQQNVTEGRVSFVGPGGDCTVNGTIRVNGVTIGIPSQTLHVIAGVSQDIDSGGPALNMSAPAPGGYVSSNSLTVSGTASDDTSVASVKVNGTTAALTSTANPADPAEVSFSATVTLAQRGPNLISTTATDVANPPKATTDTRTVYWDEGPPTLAFTPADATSTPLATALVSGTADDDAGISRVTVNGTPVAFATTGVAARPREVSFSTSLALDNGANTITVSVTDISNRVTTASHSVTRESQVATTLTASNASGAYSGTTSLVARLRESVTGNPIAGAQVTFTVFGGSTTAQTDVDGYATLAAFPLGANPVATYTVQASFGGNAQAQASSSSSVLTITKAPATLTLGGLTQGYDGSAKTATASTSPGGLSGVSFTYNGGTALPFNAGSYAVVASLTNANYVAANATGTLQIGKASATVSLTSLVHTHDGTAKAATVGTTPPGLNVAVVYAQNATAVTPIAAGVYDVSAMITEQNYLGSATGRLEINAPPALTSITGPTGPIALGGSTTIAAAFSDSATGDSHTCRFTWDDGASNQSVTATAGSCSAPHTYNAAGVYEVAVSVIDDDGLSVGGTFQYVVIYDPNAGFVTGGGWIQSAAGSYVAEPTLAGKASFGFVSKYQKGRTVPTGETQFQFEVASFRFQSVSYEWLVVSGAKGQYKGRGSVNGTGDFGFLLTSTDGQVSGGGSIDKLRIKIWDIASGAIVYDNVLGASDDINAASPQALGGGSIVIHAK